MLTLPIALAIGIGLIVLTIGVVLTWSSPILFIIAHVASRTLLDSLHTLTYAKVGPGVSIVMLYSVAVTGFMGLYLLVKGQLRLTPWGIWALAMVFCGLPGTVLTGAWGGFVLVVIRWIYLWLMIEMTRYTVERSGPRAVAIVLSICLLYPIANVTIEGLLHGGHLGAGQESYIGSFGHESNVAYVLMGQIALACGLVGLLRSPFWKLVFVGLTLIGLVALYLDNYRTALVGLFAYLLVIGYFLWKRVGSATRLQVVLFGGVAFLLGAFVLGPDIVAKLSDLGKLASDPLRYFVWTSPPTPNGMLSGRIDIMNQYMYHFVQAPFLTELTGFGLTNAEQFVAGDRYAHNEFIGALVEEGYIGFVTLVTVLILAAIRVFRSIKGADWFATNMAGITVGIVTMAMGTMPFRDSRAVLYLGIAIGMLEWYREQAGARAREAASIPPAEVPDKVAQGRPPGAPVPAGAIFRRS